MNKELWVDIGTIAKVKNFAAITSEFESDIEVVAGRYVLDGKSIMALFSVNLLEPLLVRVVSDNEEEIEIFNRVMEEFKVDD